MTAGGAGRPTENRAARVARAQELRAEGLLIREIAADMGLPYSTVSNYLSDPDLAKHRARLASYGGTCSDCGTTTFGEQKGAASERCLPCRKTYEQTVLKVWTREACIAVIQRWAREHGRPPTAREWLYKETRGDGYPAATMVYRNSGTPNAPFASWSDAVEAAGFPRPLAGHYQINPRPGDRRAA